MHSPQSLFVSSFGTVCAPEHTPAIKSLQVVARAVGIAVCVMVVVSVARGKVVTTSEVWTRVVVVGCKRVVVCGFVVDWVDISVDMDVDVLLRKIVDVGRMVIGAAVVGGTGWREFLRPK